MVSGPVQWIVVAMKSREIFGLYSVECHKVEKWSCRVGSGWVYKCLVGLCDEWIVLVIY